MSELTYHDRDFIIPNAHTALQLARDGELQSAQTTNRDRAFNPYYLEPANDRPITDLRNTRDAVQLLARLGVGEGDTVYLTPGRNFVVEPPLPTDRTTQDTQDSYFASVDSLKSTGVANVTFREGEAGSRRQRMFERYYYEVTLTQDPADIAIPETYNEHRPYTVAESPMEFLRLLRKFKVESAVAAVGITAAGAGYFEALTQSADVITTPMLIVGSYAVFRSSKNPLKRYTRLDRDYRYAMDAHEWWVNQQNVPTIQQTEQLDTPK